MRLAIGRLCQSLCLILLCFGSSENVSAAVLFQLHDNGEIWSFDGKSKCPAEATTPCPGWTFIDRNPNTKSIKATIFNAYQLHGNGEIYRWDGEDAHLSCPSDVHTPCPGWTLIDRNPSTKDIFVGNGAAMGAGLLQLHTNGEIWSYDDRAKLKCAAEVNAPCPGWTLIDRNPNTDGIVAGGGMGVFPALYQIHKDKQIFAFLGESKCPDDANAPCPGWRLIDRNPNTKEIIVADITVYQRHGDNQIWRYEGLGVASEGCSADLNTPCPGWSLIDRNPSTQAIIGGPETIYQRHANGEIWSYGSGKCPDNANLPCPGWTLIDRNPSTKDISAGADDKLQHTLFQRHNNGEIWSFAGSHCPDDVNVPCPGWTLIDRNPSTKVIVAPTGVIAH